MEIKAVLFDLDGVITDTAKYHFESWKKVVIDYGIYLPDSFDEELKGLSRADSLKEILRLGNVKINDREFENALEEKNNIYREILEHLTEKDILPGIKKLMRQLRNDGVKIIVASGSVNAPFILQKLKMDYLVDAIVDPSKAEHPKPHPAIFLNAQKLANVEREFCVGVEDAKNGVRAINSAGIFSIGIGNLPEANLCLASTEELTYELLKKL